MARRATWGDRLWWALPYHVHTTQDEGLTEFESPTGLKSSKFGTRVTRERLVLTVGSLFLLAYLVPFASVFLNGTSDIVSATAETGVQGTTEYAFSRKVGGELISYQIRNSVKFNPDHLRVYCSKTFPSICEVEERRAPWLVGTGIFYILLLNGLYWGLPYLLRTWTKK